MLLTSDINLLVDCDKLANICKTLATVHRLNGQQKSNSTSHVNTTGLVNSAQDFELAPAAALRTETSKSLCDLMDISQQSRSFSPSADYHFDFTDGNVDSLPSFPVSKLRKRNSDPVQSIIPQGCGKSDIQFNGTETKSCRTDPLRTYSIFNCQAISYGAKNISSKKAAQKRKELVKHEASFPRKTALSVEEICKRAYDFIYDFDDIEQIPNSNSRNTIVGRCASNDILSEATMKQSHNKKTDKTMGMKYDTIIGGNKHKTDIQCDLQKEIPVINLVKQYLHTKYSDNGYVPGTIGGKLLTTPTFHKKIPKEQKVSKFLSIFNETTEIINRDICDVSAVHNNSKQTQSIIQEGTSNINFNNGNNSSSAPINFYENSDNISYPSGYASVTKTVKDFRKNFSEHFETHSPLWSLRNDASNGELKPGIEYKGTNIKHCIKQKEKQYGPANRSSDTKLVNSSLKSRNQSESCITENRTISRSAFPKKSNIPKYVHFADIV